MSKNTSPSATGAIASLAMTGLIAASVVGGSYWLQQQQQPIDSYLIINVSDSMRGSGQLEELTQHVCKGMQDQTFTGDFLTVIPFADTSKVTHATAIQNRMDVLGLCKEDKLFSLLDPQGVAKGEGTSLAETLERLQHQESNLSNAEKQNSVISILIHADDQGTGAENAIALKETAKRAEALLNDGTVLVFFAVDADLQRDLQAVLHHPRVKVSALSPESIEATLLWAFSTARTSQGE